MSDGATKRSKGIRSWTAIVFAFMVFGQARGIASAGLSNPDAVPQQNARKTMNLRVSLLDGFQNSTVSIRVDDKEIYHKGGVTSNLTVSFADAVNVPTEQAAVKLEVSVDGGPSATKEIRPRETPFVAVRIVGGRMELNALKDEPPML